MLTLPPDGEGHLLGRPPLWTLGLPTDKSQLINP